VKLYDSFFYPEGSRKAGQPPRLVKDGMCWPCLFLGWLGLLVLGSWLSALLAGTATLILLTLSAAVQPGWPILVGFNLLLALFGNDLRRWELGLRGLARGPVVAGTGRDAALLRLLDEWTPRQAAAGEAQHGRAEGAGEGG